MWKGNWKSSDLGNFCVLVTKWNFIESVLSKQNELSQPPDDVRRQEMKGFCNALFPFSCRMDLLCVDGWFVTVRIPQLIFFVALNVTQDLAVSASIKMGKPYTTVVTPGSRTANSVAAW